MIKCEYQKAQSRKWKLVLLVILVSAIGTFIPPMISTWIFGSSPLVIISGTEFVSALTLVVSAYFSANVWQKHVENKNTSLLSNVILDSKENGESENAEA